MRWAIAIRPATLIFLTLGACEHYRPVYGGPLYGPRPSAQYVPAPAAGRNTPVVAAVRRTAPAVVSVVTEERPVYNPFGFSGLDPDGEAPGGRISLGSGVIIDSRGYVVTNEHVVAGAARIRVQLSDGREMTAVPVGADQSFDLAVLRVNTQGRELPVAPIGTARDLMIGETVIAIGNPFGLSHTVTSGVVSAVHRTVHTRQRTYEDFIQTDAPINPGNSGGPLLNINGELIGINTAVHSGGPGIGFAIPVDRARTIIEDLLQFGRVRAAWFGIRPQPARLRGEGGVVVAEVEPGSPAEAAGVRPGDVILEVEGEPTVSMEAYWMRVRQVLPGQEVRLKLARGEVRLVAKAEAPQVQATRVRRRLGLEVGEAGGRAVAILKVYPEGPALRAGLQSGDAILQLGTAAIRTLADFDAALTELREGADLVMLVVRGRSSYYVMVSL